MADRFHLLSALREAVERYVHRVRPDLRQLLVAADAADARGLGDGLSPSPATIDAPPAPQYDSGPARRCVQAAKHTERERRFQQVKDAQRRGLNRRQVARNGIVSPNGAAVDGGGRAPTRAARLPTGW